VGLLAATQPIRNHALMRTLTIVAGLVLAIAGCGKNKFDQAISDMESLRDRMCGCTDKACVDQVDADFKEFRKGMREKFTKDDDKAATEEQVRKAKDADRAFGDCRAKHRGSAAGDKPADPAKP
jgi:hypothetical protein